MPTTEQEEGPRCYFQVHCGTRSSPRIVRLKLAPNCPLLHLFQHPRIGLSNSNPTLRGFTFVYENTVLQPEKTPSDYGMTTGQDRVNIVAVNEESSQPPPPLQQSQQSPSASSHKHTTSSTSAGENRSIMTSPTNDVSATFSSRYQAPALNNPTSRYLPAPNNSRSNSATTTTTTPTPNTKTAGNQQQQITSPTERLRAVEYQTKSMQVRHEQEVEHLQREAQNTIDTLEARVKSQQSTISSLNERTRQLQSELLASEQKVDLAEQRASSQDKNQRAASQEQQQSMLRDLSMLQESVAKAEQKSQESQRYRERAELLEKQQKKLQQDFNQLQEICGGYRSQLDKRIAEASDLRSEYDSLQRENDQLVQEAALGSQNAVRTATREERNRERRESHRQLILDLQSQQNLLSEQLSATRAALEREVTSASEYRTNLDLAVRDLKEARNAAQSSESRLDEEIATRRQIQNQLEHEKRRRVEERESLMKEVSQLEESLRNSERKVTQLDEDLRIAKSKTMSPQRQGRGDENDQAGQFSAPMLQNHRGDPNVKNNNNNNTKSVSMVRLPMSPPPHPFQSASGNSSSSSSSSHSVPPPHAHHNTHVQHNGNNNENDFSSSMSFDELLNHHALLHQNAPSADMLHPFTAAGQSLAHPASSHSAASSLHHPATSPALKSVSPSKFHGKTMMF